MLRVDKPTALFETVVVRLSTLVPASLAKTCAERLDYSASIFLIWGVLIRTTFLVCGINVKLPTDLMF